MTFVYSQLVSYCVYKIIQRDPEGQYPNLFDIQTFISFNVVIAWLKLQLNTKRNFQILGLGRSKFWEMASGAQSSASPPSTSGPSGSSPSLLSFMRCQTGDGRSWPCRCRLSCSPTTPTSSPRALCGSYLKGECLKPSRSSPRLPRPTGCPLSGTWHGFWRRLRTTTGTKLRRGRGFATNSK